MSMIRIQDADGQGVYQSSKGLLYSDFNKFSSMLFDSDSKHPSPSMDSKLSPIWTELVDICVSSNFIFGFSDYKQMRAWFFSDDLLLALADNGFEIVIISGEIHHGHTQAIVNKNTMIVERTVPLLDFLIENE